MFRNICNPLVNRSTWSPPEDDRLKALVDEHGHQNWVKVAEELGVRLTALVYCLDFIFCSILYYV